MTHLKLNRKESQQALVTHGLVADRYWLRLRGLIGRKKFAAGEGLYFPNCNSVHMWMMSMPIDIVFLSKELQILQLHSQVPAWKLFPLFCSKAESVLELPAGTIQNHALQVGEVLCHAS